MDRERARIGDVVIDRTYCKDGILGVVVGKGINQPVILKQALSGGLYDYFSSWRGITVIGHIDIEALCEKAIGGGAAKGLIETAKEMEHERGR